MRCWLPTISFAALLVATGCRGATENLPVAPTPDPIPTSAPTPVPTLSFLIAGAGDVGDCNSPVASGATANLLAGANAVFTAGDNAQDQGAPSEYANCYGPTWGRFFGITHPVPGNHDWQNPVSYMAYFHMPSYYYWEAGPWHAIALNSEDSSNAQLDWLRADLAAHSGKCVLAQWHRPLWSSGTHGRNPDMKRFWDILVGKASIVLNGHDHIYERFAPQDATGKRLVNGIRQFTVGTGGFVLTGIGSPEPNSEALVTSQWGVLKLTLTQNAYAWQFATAGGSIADSGTSSCATVTPNAR